METTAREDAACDHSHSADTPLDETHPRQDDEQVLPEGGLAVETRSFSSFDPSQQHHHHL